MPVDDPTVGSADISQPAPEPVTSLLSRLRTAIATPQDERPADWEDQTARLVALVAVDYLKQEDSAIALQELALVGLAALRGCKAARKRDLNPLRWRDLAPPPLSQVFIDADEAKAAIKALASLRADWVVDYVVADLSSPLLSGLQRDLMQWASANAPRLDMLIVSISQALAAQDRADHSALLAAVSYLLKPESLPIHALGEQFLASLVTLVSNSRSATVEAAGPSSTNKAASSLQSQVIHAVDAATAMRPHLLLDAAAPQALHAALALSGQLATTAKDGVLRVLQRAVDLLGVVLALGTESARSSTKLIAAAFAAALPESLKAPQERAALTRLATPDAAAERSNSEVASADTAIEEAIASLLSDWDAYASAHSVTPPLNQVRHQIDAIAHIARVERFGVPGEKVSYAPFHHHLTAPASTPPLQVEVLKPGIKITRLDGSERVLLMALAAPITPRSPTEA